MMALMSHAVTQESVFVRACRTEPVPYTPVWFMRQAGRSLPEYRAAREGVSMLDACRRPELVCELTLQPVRRHVVDAAILFSDIVVPLVAAGVDLRIVPGVGPVLDEPVRDRAGVDRLRALELDGMEDIAEAIRLARVELGGTPLIGFAGAPFTLASYLVEGGPSRHHEHTKALMYRAPELWHGLCAWLAEITLKSLRVQVAAGVSAVQLFDSWAGALSEKDYRRFALPHSGYVLRGLSDAGVPRIHFGVGTHHLLRSMTEAGADVIGVDWRTPLDAAAELVGPGVAVQGNLDPTVLFAPWPVIEAEVRQILDAGKAASGHVFNLGHGVLPETDPDILTRVVALVHELSSR
jgi:uroporphyrinogen decarboxylase